jgi:hypothetical protein
MLSDDENKTLPDETEKMITRILDLLKRREVRREQVEALRTALRKAGLLDSPGK